MFAPDPGAPEQSQIGGNIATNAGGPHAFKYGVVGDWVTGLEAALPAGRARLRRRRDPQGRRRLRPEAAAGRLGGDARDRHRRVAEAPAGAGGRAAGGGVPRGTAEGCAALLRVVGSGIVAAALDVLDAETLACGAASFPGGVPDGAGFVLLAEADGSRGRGGACPRRARRGGGRGRCRRLRARRPRGRRRVLALAVGPGVRGARAARRRGRRGHRRPARPRRGGDGRDARDRPPPRPRRPLASATPATATSTRRSSSLRMTPTSCARAELAVEELFDVAVRLGGSVSGEHGLGPAEARPAGAAVVRRVRSTCTRRSSASSTRRTCSTRARSSPARCPASLTRPWRPEAELVTQCYLQARREIVTPA